MNADIFKAYDIRGRVGTELTTELCWNVGKALADWLPEDGSVAVGYDMRPDSQELAMAIIEGLRLQGRDVVNIGNVSTDMIYFAVGHLGLAGGAMVTASHNPGDYNGIKLCREEARPIGIDSGLADIRDAVLAGNFVPSAEKGAVEDRDVREDWVKHVLGFVDAAHWAKYRIAVDAGNGMAGAIMPVLATYVPCELVPMYWELDGTFPNHEANPMKVETLRDLSAMVQEHDDIDFGIAFDGDGDRVAFVDEDGEPVSGSMIFALLASRILKQEPGAAIVHELRMSRSTLRVIEDNGGKPVRSKVGNPYIKQLMREHNAPLGGETTGHFMIRDNFYIDSGLMAAVLVLAELSETNTKLRDFVAAHSDYKVMPEVNLEVEDKSAAIERVAEALTDGEQDRLDGLTVSYPGAWINVRPSNTEPLLRLNAEAKDEVELNALVERVKAIIAS